jgi:hypothetical protein
MARTIKIDGKDSREKYSYLAYPKKLDRTFQAMVIEDGGKYGIETVKDAMKNILMEAVIYWEKHHRFIEAREWAAENWIRNRHSDLSASNVDDKLKPDVTKLLAKQHDLLAKQMEEIKRLQARTQE